MTVIAFTPKAPPRKGQITTLAVKFLERKQARGRATNTLVSYRVDLEQMAGYLDEYHGITVASDVRKVHLEELVDAWMEMHTAATVARKLSTVRSFFQHCVNDNHLSSNPADGLDPITVHARRVIAPPMDTILEMIDAIPADERSVAGVLGLRDRAFFRTMFVSGTRVSGMLSLDIYDPAHIPAHTIHPDGVMTYLNKGQVRLGTSVIDDSCRDLVDRYLARRSRLLHAENSALWLSTQGTRPTRQAMLDRIKKHGKRVGITVTNHMLRHARAHDILKVGDLDGASNLLNHSTRAVTVKVYGTELAAVSLRRVSKQYPIRPTLIRGDGL